jgi:hypothetical protein
MCPAPFKGAHGGATALHADQHAGLFLGAGKVLMIAYTQLWEGALQRVPNRHRQLSRFFEKCHYVASLQRLLLIRARGWGLIDPDAPGRPTFI